MFLFSFERYAQNASIKTAQNMNKVSDIKKARATNKQTHTHTHEQRGGFEDEVKNKKTNE